MTIEGISHITLVVHDLERTGDLFSSVLGAKEVYASGETTFSLSKERFFVLGGAWFALMEGDPLSERTYNHVAFKIPESEFDDYRRRLEGAEVAFRGDRARVPGDAQSLYFYDYDGHLFELHTGTLNERLRAYAGTRPRAQENHMATACTTRKLDGADAEAWASLRREALETHPLVFGSSVPADPTALVDFVLKQLASSDGSAVLGAFVDGLLIGIVGIRRDAGAKERHKAFVWGMYVTAAMRRRGAGDLLLRAAIQLARSWTGVEQIHLAVTEDAEEARRLYEKNGFREWGREPRSLCWDGRCVDETHMILDLRGSR